MRSERIAGVEGLDVLRPGNDSFTMQIAVDGEVVRETGTLSDLRDVGLGVKVASGGTEISCEVVVSL